MGVRNDLPSFEVPPNVRVFNSNRAERNQEEKQSLSHRGEGYILC
jgi:hypothetical protein